METPSSPPPPPPPRPNFYIVSTEHYRLNSFKGPYSWAKPLAKAGYFLSRTTEEKAFVECIVCRSEIELGENIKSVKEQHKNPKCLSYKEMLECQDSNNIGRPKQFYSFKYLHYEKERLETFIDWPTPGILPTELAKDGFFYTRQREACVCVFCRTVIDDWKIGGGVSVREQHEKANRLCKFINGGPVGNVPMEHSAILDTLPLDDEYWPLIYDDEKNDDDDDASLMNIKVENTISDGDELMEESHYTTLENRLQSFKIKGWPSERVLQTPEELAAAGFYATGFTDHVRCFSCGLGLHNWDATDGDDVWAVHAKYWSCPFLLSKKSTSFIRQVRKKTPIYLRSVALKGSKPRLILNPEGGGGGGFSRELSSDEIDILMQQDVMQYVIKMGPFKTQYLRELLIRRINTKGQPFLSVKQCLKSYIDEYEEIKKIKEILLPPLEHEYYYYKFCRICMKNSTSGNVILLPCRHMAICPMCTAGISVCPICNSRIEGTVKPILTPQHDDDDDGTTTTTSSQYDDDDDDNDGYESRKMSL